MGVDRKNEAGFTLIEGMITLAIFSFVIFLMMQMQYSLERTMYGGRDRGIAVYLAQEKLEEFKGLSYDDPSMVNGSDTVQGLARSWTITADTPDTSTRTISVQVSWGSPAKTIALSTIIGKKDE